MLLSIVPATKGALTLAWARGTGPWREFADLRLDDDPQNSGDEPLSFDPVRHPLPGLATYRWVRRLREPASAAARASRATPTASD